MIWSIDIEFITAWYWALIGLLLAVSVYGTWKHKTSIPILWGALVSVILFYGAETLEPLIFGYKYYVMYSVQWFLVGALGIMFGLIFLQYAYNIITKGTVIE